MLICLSEEPRQLEDSTRVGWKILNPVLPIFQTWTCHESSRVCECRRDSHIETVRSSAPQLLSQLLFTGREHGQGTLVDRRPLPVFHPDLERTFGRSKRRAGVEVVEVGVEPAVAEKMPVSVEGHLEWGRQLPCAR